VTFLLDVNVLLALGCARHVHHEPAERWRRQMLEVHGDALHLATCAITELGFVRIACGTSRLVENLSVACSGLQRLKASGKFVFLGDHLGADRLPPWVGQPGQTTDGHLTGLAAAHGTRLATFDRGIPGAFLIPAEPSGGWSVREPSVEAA